MAELDKNGREVLDQTPVSLPIHFDRPEPIHMRLRRMILEATMDQKAGDETFEDANDFEIEDDPSSYDTGYTEPDLEPAPQVAYTDEEIAAARAVILQMRQQKSQAEPSDAAGQGGVSSPPEAAAEPRQSAAQSVPQAEK